MNNKDERIKFNKPRPMFVNGKPVEFVYLDDFNKNKISDEFLEECRRNSQLLFRKDCEVNCE